MSAAVNTPPSFSSQAALRSISAAASIRSRFDTIALNVSSGRPQRNILRPVPIDRTLLDRMRDPVLLAIADARPTIEALLRAA
jgi:hypothetical protein